jgi:tRNA dimethylallyltransferase
MLHNKINTRVDQMFDNGLEYEARNLYHLRHLNALNTVGYRELFAYFEGETTLEKAIELIKRNSRRYARKQITWFRNDNEMKWFEPEQSKEIISFIENQISEK